MTHPMVLCLVIVIFFPGISIAACGSPGRPAMGNVMDIVGQEEYEEGYSLKYYCNAHYFLFQRGRSENRTCINGSWTGKMPGCSRTLCNFYKFKLETTGNTRFYSSDLCEVKSDLPEVNKPEYWKIKMNKKYHVSFVGITLETSGSTTCQPTQEVYKDLFNISLPNNSSTRFFNHLWKLREPQGYPCDYYYQMEDDGSPLADTINIEVKNSLRIDGISVHGIEPDNDCGQPDSPLYSDFTYSRVNLTAFYKCKQGYRAVGDDFVSRCTDELKWTKLNMQCLKSKDGRVKDPVASPTAVSDTQLAVILIIPLGLLVCVLSFILGKILYRSRKKRREQQKLIKKLQRLQENRQDASYSAGPLDEQANLFSFARRWEFPKNRLKLGSSSERNYLGISHPYYS